MSEVIVYFDGTLDGLKAALFDLYNDFDVDEHVELLLGARDTVSGVPSAKTLVNDAEAIEKFYEALEGAFEGFENTLPKRKREVLETIPEELPLSR